MKSFCFLVLQCKQREHICHHRNGYLGMFVRQSIWVAKPDELVFVTHVFGHSQDKWRKYKIVQISWYKTAKTLQ